MPAAASKSTQPASRLAAVFMTPPLIGPGTPHPTGRSARVSSSIPSLRASASTRPTTDAIASRTAGGVDGWGVRSRTLALTSSAVARSTMAALTPVPPTSMPIGGGPRPNRGSRRDAGHRPGAATRRRVDRRCTCSSRHEDSDGRPPDAPEAASGAGGRAAAYRCDRRDVRPVRRLQAPAARPRPGRDRRIGSIRWTRSSRPTGRRARPVHPLPAAQARAPAEHRAAAADPDALHQHHLARAGAAVPGRRGHGAAHPAHGPLERRGDGPARQQRLSRASAATWRPTPRRRACTRSASITSSAARTPPGMGDQIFFQGHAAPGIYARAFLEGRLSEDQLDHFRREVVPGQGLSARTRTRGSMPDFWEFPTVSMGLGPAGRDLPGALQPLPPRPGHQGHQRQPGVGVPRATARWTSRSRWARCRSPRARGSTT